MQSRILKLCCFAFAICVGLVGCFLTLDAGLPKERAVSPWASIGEFAVGVLFLGVAFWLGRKNRLRQKPRNAVAPPRANGE
jgi:hypothetical protein